MVYVRGPDQFLLVSVCSSSSCLSSVSVCFVLLNSSPNVADSAAIPPRSVCKPNVSASRNHSGPESTSPTRLRGLSNQLGPHECAREHLVRSACDDFVVGHRLSAIAWPASPLGRCDAELPNAENRNLSGHADLLDLLVFPRF